MRILRGKSNLEVSSHGFALFVVGLILATFIGGAVRTLLASDRVHQMIVNDLKRRFPKQDIKIGGAEVLLSRGIWPALGLKVSDLKFMQETCDRLSFTLEVPSAVLPINLWSLRSGKPRLGEIELNNGQLKFDYHPCPKATASETLVTPHSASPSSSTTGARGAKNFKFDWQEWGSALDGAELNEFAVTYAENPNWKILIRYAQLDFSGDFGLHSKMEVLRSLPFGTVTHPVEMEAHSEDSVLNWSMASEFKEGRARWKGSWDTKSQAAMFNVEISQLPIKEALNELFQMGMLEREVEMRTTWISCAANWEGTVSALAETPVHLRNCRLEGAYGGLQMEQADVYPLQEQFFKVPVELKAQNLQVQPLVQALNRKILPAVINKLGQWSGSFRFLNKNSWSLDGWLDNAEIVFSNQSVRGKQGLRRVHTRAEKVQGVIAAKVDQLEFIGGEFGGFVEFTLQDDWRSGQFRAQIDNLKLSPAIQNLLVGGGWNDLKVRGSGTLEAGELKDWKGSFESSQIHGEGWISDSLSVQSRYAPGLFTFEGRAKSIRLEPAWRHYANLKEHLRSKNEQVSWRDLQTKVEVRQIGGEILQLNGIEAESGRSWRGKGSWQRDRDLVLSISGYRDGQPHLFTVRSDKGTFVIDESAPAR